jgi:hypothetical protein
MTTTHAPIGWTAGDDWQINATLLDENGDPFDLSGAHEIKWALMNINLQRVLDEDDVSVSITDALAGECSILIPAAKTSPLAGGHYTDAIRIVIGGITSTLSYGQITVVVDPWAVAEATMQYRKPQLVAG